MITRWEFSDIKKENTDIIPIITTLSEQIWEQYKEKNIQYTQQLPAYHTVSGQSDVIKIILSNIITNAYKFTPQKWSINLTIEKNKIIVSDNGIGMSPSDQEKIRTRFWKRSTENNSWYGLGLYMVKLLIEKLGRSISVESEENKWTTFVITMN